MSDPTLPVQPSEAAELGTPRPIRGERLMSLDVFRGVTMAAMMMVNNPGEERHYAPLDHSQWHGWTFTDTVFPFFLWIVGVAIPFSLGRRVEEGANRWGLVLKIVRRSLIIVGIGLFLNMLPFLLGSIFSPHHEGFVYWMTRMSGHVNGQAVRGLRYFGVLQRIGICYLFAGLIFITTKTRGQMIWVAVLLAAYWVLMKYVPVPGHGAGVLDQHGNLEEYIDSMFFSGHMYRKTYDPEGTISTLPSIATALFGILTGQLVRRKDLAPAEKTAWLYVMGSLLLFAGSLLNLGIPINKNIWTSSYSVFMAGMAATVFATYYWLIDIKGYKKWAKPFAIYGMNAITVYTLAFIFEELSEAVTNSHGVSLQDMIYRSTIRVLSKAGYIPTEMASMLYGLIVYSLGFYLVAWFMYRRKWFVRF